MQDQAFEFYQSQEKECCSVWRQRRRQAGREGGEERKRKRKRKKEMEPVLRRGCHRALMHGQQQLTVLAILGICVFAVSHLSNAEAANNESTSSSTGNSRSLDEWLREEVLGYRPDPTEGDVNDEDHLPRRPLEFDDRVFSQTIKDAKHKVTQFLRSRGLAAATANASSTTKTIVVAKDGSGHFRTVQAAINKVPASNTKRIIIYIKKGVYNEKVTIPSGKDFITLKGESAALTYIQWSDTASTLDKKGQPLGTYGSASVAVEADNFIALDISFKVCTTTLFRIMTFPSLPWIYICM